MAIEADALHLPLRAESLDLIVTAFGFRNLANYEAGLKEFHRVLKPGGQLGILEFSKPGGLMGKAYAVYFRRVLPAIGRMICGKDGPYNYLPSSVGDFPPPSVMVEMMQAAGFAQCAWQPYTFGIAGLYTAERLTYSRKLNDYCRLQFASDRRLPQRTSPRRSSVWRGTRWQRRRR